MEILRVENLSKIYGKGHTQVRALDNVSLASKRRIHCHYRYPVPASPPYAYFRRDCPTSGKVFIDNTDIYNLCNKAYLQKKADRPYLSFIT